MAKNIVHHGKFAAVVARVDGSDTVYDVWRWNLLKLLKCWWANRSPKNPNTFPVRANGELNV